MSVVKKTYPSYEAMIQDLRERSKSSDPKVKKEAEHILNELWRKWAEQVKNEFGGKKKSKQVKTFVLS